MMIFRPAVVAVSLSAAAVSQSPNVLLIVADDVGVDVIGCYGQPNAAPTPNIDALAGQGIRFDNAHACPTCSPTRASLFTGRHGFRTGIGAPLTGASEGLLAGEVLLPEILPPSTTTALIGKWHLGNDQGAQTPTAEGFDVFTGVLGGAVPSYYAWNKVENGQTSVSTNYITTELVDDALAFVQTTNTPWFLTVSFNAPHTPYEAPPASLHSQDLSGLDPVSDPVPFYDAMLEAMDTEIGRLLAGIPAATLAETTILFVGDNGTAPGVVQPPFDPQRSKGSVYQGGVRVPMIAAGYAVGGAPRTEPRLVHVVDFFHTIAALRGVSAPAAVPASVPLDGVSFAPLLATANVPGGRSTVYTSGFSGSESMANVGDAEMMRDARFELVRTVRAQGIREELFDLATDPFELSNLLEQPLSPATESAYRRLSAEIAQLRGVPSVVGFGVSCSGAGIAPRLRAVSQPVVDTNYRARVSGLDGAALAVVGVLGFDDDNWAGVALPLESVCLRPDRLLDLHRTHHHAPTLLRAVCCNLGGSATE